MGFWSKLKKPFFLLAPMADVTDAAFRRIIARESRVSERDDVALWTEFVSADGLFRGGFKALSKDLIYTEAERPIVAQFFSNSPEYMKEAASLAREMGFDGVDINMGCPARAIVRQGAGCGLIKDPERAKEVIEAAKEGAGNLPVSVKTRIGFNKNEVETWIPELLSAKPAAIIIHARTRKEMSKVPARWGVVKRAVEIRNEKGSDALVVGNGDVMTLAEAREKVSETGADGVMMGRAVFGNPWIFREDISWSEIPPEDKLRTLAEHAELFEELFGDSKNFFIMKKHFKAYVKGFPGASELREVLMKVENSAQVREIADNFAVIPNK